MFDDNVKNETTEVTTPECEKCTELAAEVEEMEYAVGIGAVAGMLIGVIVGIFCTIFVVKKLKKDECK